MLSKFILGYVTAFHIVIELHSTHVTNYISIEELNITELYYTRAVYRVFLRQSSNQIGTFLEGKVMASRKEINSSRDRTTAISLWDSKSIH